MDGKNGNGGCCRSRARRAHSQNMYQISAAVMRTHESKQFPGGIIASLAIPWGESKGDQDQGYHLVWRRDMIQTVGGLLAVRGHEDARRALFISTSRRMRTVTGRKTCIWMVIRSWTGIRMDETAFVILLVDLARREVALGDQGIDSLWEMVRKAAGYLVCHGPITPLDRWEEECGYFASTLPVEIAALLAAAEMADGRGEPQLATFLRETADTWNAEIESLLYVTGTTLAQAGGS